VIDQDVARSTVIRTLVKWCVLGAFILLVRFLRWGGMLGLIGIGTFAGAIRLAFHLANPDPGELTGTEGTAVLALVMIGVGLYVIGVGHQRRRMPPMSDAP
jgi:hypothetical protein